MVVETGRASFARLYFKDDSDITVERSLSVSTIGEGGEVQFPTLDFVANTTLEPRAGR
jgi:hypothetical protein